MKLETLQVEKIKAIKDKDSIRKEAISAMIDAIQKASITPKGRIEITDQLVDETLIKYQKTVQEMIDTCPTGRTDLLQKYEAEMNVVKQYAPQLITDANIIKSKMIIMIETAGLELDRKKKGAIMKLASAEFKGKADMKVVNAAVQELLQ